MSRPLLSSPLPPTPTSPKCAAAQPRSWLSRLRIPLPGRRQLVDHSSAIDDPLASVRVLLATDAPAPTEKDRLTALLREMAGHGSTLVALLEHQHRRGRGLTAQERRLVARAGQRARRKPPTEPGTAAVIELVQLAELVQGLALLAGQPPRPRRSTARRPVPAGGAR